MSCAPRPLKSSSHSFGSAVSPSRAAPGGLDLNPSPPLVPAFDRLSPPQPAEHSQRREVVRVGQVHPERVVAARAVDLAWAASRPNHGAQANLVPALGRTLLGGFTQQPWFTQQPYRYHHNQKRELEK
jgi:hypothetical protein